MEICNEVPVRFLKLRPGHGTHVHFLRNRTVRVDTVETISRFRRRESGRSIAVKAQSVDNGASEDQNGSANGDGLEQPSKRDRVLPLSMFTPFGRKLPPDGRLQTEEEEFCDPYERSCQTPMYVWESKCEACSGLGQVRSSSVRAGRGRGNRSLYSGTYYTCLSCNGLGYVRRTSSRFRPDLNGGNGPDFTLGRPPSDDEGEGSSSSSSRNGTGPYKPSGRRR